MQVLEWRWGMMKMKYSTWYRSCSDTKIKKKEKNTYLCNDKMPLAIVLGCIYIHILITCLHWFRRNSRKYWLRERMRNKWCMSRMSLMCSYNHGEIIGSGWFHEGFLSHVSHESCAVIDISNRNQWYGKLYFVSPTITILHRKIVKTNNVWWWI